MKKFLTKFLALSSVALLMLSACKKDGTLVTSNGGKAGTLAASTTTPVLDHTKLGDTTAVVRFTFTKADYGYSAAITNTLQIDAASDNWANPTTAVLPVGTFSQGYSTAVFNNLVLKLNLPAGTASQVVVRIAHSLSANVKPVYSNVIALTVTPFNLTSWIYITGAFSGWQNPGPNEDSLISVTGNGIYTGIINFNATGGGANQFLLLPAKKWDHKYATSDNTTPSSTITYDASNNLNAPAANGQYIVTANLKTNTISFAAADYYSIIGSATPGGNWSTDMFLKFVNDGNNNWVGTFSLLAGQFKFRQDGQWSNSWGDVSPADGINATDSNGGNINATAGTHTVTFNMAPSAVGSAAVKTTTYSLK
ncbi:MAG: SusE domain-containing protein [Sphingobacteriales bacterium]